MSRELVLDVLDLCVRLRFSSSTQRLIFIDCYSPSSLTFRYRHSSFSGPLHPPPSLSSVYQSIGPTYPPYWDDRLQSYFLHYPGLSFAFHNTADPTTPIQTSDFDALDHTQTALSRLFIHYSNHLSSHSPPPPPPIALPSPSPPIQAHPTRGLYLAPLHLWLTFDSTHIQDLLLDMGAPSCITPKAEDKMRIHAGVGGGGELREDGGGGKGGVGGNGGGAVGRGGSDVFYNYYDWGLDVLMEGRSGRMVKAVLHCNMPGGREFGRYRRAECVVVVGGGKKGVGGGGGGGVGEMGVGKGGGGVVGVSGGARWTEVERVIRECGGEVSRGMLNGGGERGSNPFGSTMLYATRGVLFEVLKSGYLQSITLFRDV